MPPLIFHVVEGCGIKSRTVATVAFAVRRSYSNSNSARSPLMQLTLHPDPAFHCDADPDPDPASLIRILYGSRVTSHGSIVIPSRLQGEPPRQCCRIQLFSLMQFRIRLYLLDWNPDPVRTMMRIWIRNTAWGFPQITDYLVLPICFEFVNGSSSLITNRYSTIVLYFLPISMFVMDT